MSDTTPDAQPDPAAEPTDTAAPTGADAGPAAAAPAGVLDGVDVSRAGVAVEPVEEEAIDFEAEPWPQAWMAGFLRNLSAMPNVTVAARSVGVVRQTAYMARGRNPRFAAAWKQAEQEAVDTLERYAHNMSSTGLEMVETRSVQERALVNGVLTVVKETTTTITKREISPQMAMFLLQAHRPEKYRKPTRLEHTGADGAPMQVEEVAADAGVGAFDAAVVRLADARRARDSAAGGGTG